MKLIKICTEVKQEENSSLSVFVCPLVMVLITSIFVISLRSCSITSLTELTHSSPSVCVCVCVCVRAREYVSVHICVCKCEIQCIPVFAMKYDLFGLVPKHLLV